MTQSAPIPTTGSNTTGTRGVIAVDKLGNKIRFYDPETLAEIKAIDGPEPCVHELAISHDHARAFVPLYGAGIYGNNTKPNNKVLVIDLARQEVSDIIELGSNVAPHGMITTKDGKLWLVCDISRKLLLVDPDSRSILAAYDCPAKGPHILAGSADGRRLYVSAKEGSVGVFDTKARVFIAAVALGKPGVESGNGSGTEGITPSPDGRRIVAIDNDMGDLRVIDASDNEEIGRIPMTQQVMSNIKRSRLGKLMFSPDGRHLVVTGYTSGNVWLLDVHDYRQQTLVPVAKGPMGMAFPPDGKSVIVSSHDSGLLTRIDLADRRAVAIYDGGAGIEVLTYY